jgi:dipeptidase E
MKKLFLTSSFIPVADLLPKFLDFPLENKHVAFIPTASVPKKIHFYVQAAEKKLQEFGLIVDVVEISEVDYEISRRVIQNADILYVCGGNPDFLLMQLRKTGVDQLVSDHINQGKPYIGESSGSVVLTKNISYVQKMVGPEPTTPLASYDALNLISFFPLPHYETFPFVQATKEIMNEYYDVIDLLPITNKQVIEVINDQRTIETID